MYFYQNSWYLLFHLQKLDFAEETLEGNKAFEVFVGEHVVKIRHYHYKNGILQEKIWINKCKDKVNQQQITYERFNMYHTIGITKYILRGLQ